MNGDRACGGKNPPRCADGKYHYGAAALAARLWGFWWGQFYRKDPTYHNEKLKMGPKSAEPTQTDTQSAGRPRPRPPPRRELHAVSRLPAVLPGKRTPAPAGPQEASTGPHGAQPVHARASISSSCAAV